MVSLGPCRYRVLAALAVASLLWPILGATRGRPGDRADRIGAAVYHCVGALAMVHATLGSDNSPSEHAHHTAAAYPANLPYPAISWLLAGLFLLDAVVVVIAVIRPRGEAAPTRLDFIVTVSPHLAMDITMVAMLVAVQRSVASSRGRR